MKYRLNYRISCLIRNGLRNGSKANRKWCDLVGYDINQLKRRLQDTMPKGFSWDDFLNGELEIDHKIPISAFNFSTPEHIDFKRCWALENLQLLPKKENREKWNKINVSFQTCLEV